MQHPGGSGRLLSVHHQREENCYEPDDSSPSKRIVGHAGFHLLRLVRSSRVSRRRTRFRFARAERSNSPTIIGTGVAKLLQNNHLYIHLLRDGYKRQNARFHVVRLRYEVLGTGDKGSRTEGPQRDTMSDLGICQEMRPLPARTTYHGVPVPEPTRP